MGILRSVSVSNVFCKLGKKSVRMTAPAISPRRGPHEEISAFAQKIEDEEAISDCNDPMDTIITESKRPDGRREGSSTDESTRWIDGANDLAVKVGQKNLACCVVPCWRFLNPTFEIC